MDQEQKQQSNSNLISNGKIHIQSFEENSIILKTIKNEQKIALARLKSIDNLILSTYAQYHCPSGSIVIKDLILIAYNMTSRREDTFVLNIPDIKISNKNFNIGRLVSLSMTKISSHTYIALIIVINLVLIILIEEDSNTSQMTHKIIYKEKKSCNRYLILGLESFENKETFSLISKPNNTLLSITCTLNENTREIEVTLNEKQLDKAKYQFDRFTQSACNWILFTEKNANRNIMLDKRTLSIYTLNCSNDLLNHSFFLMKNDDELHLITDIEENKKVSVYMFKLILNDNEKEFNSELLKVFDVNCDSYEKYVFNALNDGCFFINFYDLFVAYFYNSESKMFDKCYRFSANNCCALVQSVNFNCYNDHEDKTHMVLETYKDMKLVLLDYQLNERVFEPKKKANNEMNNQIDNNRLNEAIAITSPSEFKQDQITNEKQANVINSSIEEDKSSKETKEVKIGNNDNNNKKKKELNQIEKKIDEVIENNIASISYKIVSKYKNTLKNLENQTKKIEKKQAECDKCLDELMKSIKLKEEQMNSGSTGHQIDKIEDNNNNISKSPGDQFEYSIKENKFIQKEESSLFNSNSVIEQKGIIKESNNNEHQSNKKKNNQIPSFIPKQFQNQNQNAGLNQNQSLFQGQVNTVPINPQIMTLMMNLMGPINQMYTMLLNTMLQNQRNIPQQQMDQCQNRPNQSFSQPQNNQQIRYTQQTQSQSQPHNSFPISTPTSINSQHIVSPFENPNTPISHHDQYNQYNQNINSVSSNKIEDEIKEPSPIEEREESPQYNRNEQQQQKKKKHNNSKREDKKGLKKKKSFNKRVKTKASSDIIDNGSDFDF